MADERNVRSSDGPTCLVALLAPFLVFCAVVGYATLEGGGVTQRDADTGTVRVLTWQGWVPAGESAQQLSAPSAAVYVDDANPTAAPRPTPRPAAPVVVAAPTVGRVAPAAGGGRGTTSRYAGYSAVDPVPAAPPETTAGLSPWTLLGWILVVLVPAALLLLVGFVLYRHLRAPRARSRPPARHPGAGGKVPPARMRGRRGFARPEGTDPTVVPASMAAPGRGGAEVGPKNTAPASLGSTQLADFLHAERRPVGRAAGDSHDALVSE